jgi:hypothetical protein
MDLVEERDREPVSGELEAEIAGVCGVMNAATARLVSLLARVLETGAWQVSGVHNPTQWVAWQCGVSPARARSLLAMARRRAELPATCAAFDAGELCEDQVAVICRHAPAAVDAQVAELARAATVATAWSSPTIGAGGWRAAGGRCRRASRWRPRPASSALHGGLVAPHRRALDPEAVTFNERTG